MLGNNIKERRKILGLTQKGLGEKIGASEFTVSKYERGVNEPDILTLRKISLALNCSIDSLIENNHNETNNSEINISKSSNYILGDNIKERRKILGLTQKELSEKLNISFQTVSKYELGVNIPDAEMLIKLSDTLYCTLDYLVGKTANPDSNTYIHDDIKIGISKNYPYDLTPEQVEKLVALLKDYRFDIDSLIKDIKDGKVPEKL